MNTVKSLEKFASFYNDKIYGVVGARFPNSTERSDWKSAFIPLYPEGYDIARFRARTGVAVRAGSIS